MTDGQNNDSGLYTGIDQNEFMKRMKAIASDLWGGSAPAEGKQEIPEHEKKASPAAAEQEKLKRTIRNIWKTADETIDWTDALAHSTPTDGLTSPRLWAFYHKHAQKILEGDLSAYTEVLQKANPLGELTDFADHITIRAISPDRLESAFSCNGEAMKRDRKLYLSAMGLRIARDLLACLPVEEVTVTAEEEGKKVFTATYPRQKLLHRNFAFIDPVALAGECGAEFN